MKGEKVMAFSESFADRVRQIRKERLEERLLLYEARIFELEMDIVALKALRDAPSVEHMIEEKEKMIAYLRSAMDAVRAMEAVKDDDADL